MLTLASTWMGDHLGRPHDVNLGLFVGVDWTQNESTNILISQGSHYYYSLHCDYNDRIVLIIIIHYTVITTTELLHYVIALYILHIDLLVGLICCV